MGFNRALMFFTDGVYGWSEVYYDPTTGNPPLILTLGRAQTLAVLAKQC